MSGLAPEAEDLVAELIGQGWTYETEEPMNEAEARWWAQRPGLAGEVRTDEHPGGREGQAATR